MPDILFNMRTSALNNYVIYLDNVSFVPSQNLFNVSSDTTEVRVVYNYVTDKKLSPLYIKDVANVYINKDMINTTPWEDTNG